mmetsp:Transcript_51568/g.167430  ORF Transcript_51568/g.167430 Transcript_51568/m.167430 type:complete len:222 (-) Transcript_51568:897-1562(-)
MAWRFSTWASLAPASSTRIVCALRETAARCATALPSCCTTRTFSGNGCATRLAAVLAGASALSHTPVRSSWCRTSVRTQRQSPQRSSLHTGSRRSGALSEGPTIGRIASMPTPTAIGAASQVWAMHRIPALSGRSALQMGRPSWATVQGAPMAWLVLLLMVPRSSFTTRSSTRRIRAAIRIAGAVRSAPLHMGRMTVAKCQWKSPLPAVLLVGPCPMLRTC